MRKQENPHGGLLALGALGAAAYYAYKHWPVKTAATQARSAAQIGAQAAATAAAAVTPAVNGIAALKPGTYTADQVKGFIGALNTIGANIADYKDASGQFYSWAIGSIGANISYLLNAGATRDEIRAILGGSGLLSALAIANNELTSRGLAPIAA